jgi:DNA-directed RNA polymerase specialized sigma24 family protein
MPSSRGASAFRPAASPPTAEARSSGIRVDRRRGLLDDIPPAIAAALDAWAAWVGRYQERIGYGSTSVAWRLMQAKRTGVASRGTAPDPDMPWHIAQIDRAVARLERRERKAIRTYYLTYAPCEDKAKRCRCSVPEFYRRLRSARDSVSAFLQRECR